MNTSSTTLIDWQQWLQRWDAQQTRYLPDREARFDVMLDAVEALTSPDCVALDLACGPGAISQRLLTRFPQASAIAIDYNPILLHLGQQALGTYDGRLQWLKGNLADPTWSESIRQALNAIGRTHVDAVLSTTALHWLAIDELVQVYHQLGDLVRPGGIVLNGDHMAYPPALPAFRNLAQRIKDQRGREVFDAQGGEDYTQWWHALQAAMHPVPELRPLLDEYRRNEQHRRRNTSNPIGLVHAAALADAGFDQVGVIWQRFDNQVLLAIRGEPLAPVTD
jgi:SAM-dependent methyltransferase